MDFNKFYVSGNGNEYPLQTSHLLIYFISDVNMTSLSLMILMSSDNFCCMRGEFWSSRRLMAQLT